MKKLKLLRHLCAAILAGILAYSWLFPQTIFRDCIHVVFSRPQTEESQNFLTEEEYLDLFQLQKSEYKVTWKFFQKD